MASRARYQAAAATLLLALALPLRAGAEPTAQEKETARALMDQGDESFEQKSYAAALKAYAGAHAIMRVPTTAIEVAKAHEALGNLVEARDALLEAIRFPKSSDEPAAYTGARAEAEKRASALGDRIPSIVVKLDGLPQGVEPRVTVDRVALPAAAALLPIKVNPGRHKVLVSSDATYDASQDVDVAERQNVVVPIALKPRPISERPVSSAPGSSRSSSSPLRTAALISGGAGLVGLAVGGFFGLQAKSKQDDADCPGNVCKDEASASTLRSANDAATLSTIAFVAGGALVAGGITLWLVGSSSSPKTASVRLSPMMPASAASGGIAAFGTF